MSRFLKRICAFCALLAADVAAAEPKPPAEVAAAVDVALSAGADKALSDDVTFLRRVSLDLTGKVPGPAEIAAFAKDDSPNKRARLIERLLADEAYAVNWGRY